MTYQTPIDARSIPDNEIRRLAGVNDALLLIGRIVLVLIYVFSGAAKFMDLAGTAAQIASKGLPAPMALATLAAAAEVLGGIAVIVGFQTRFAALGLLVYTLVTVYFFHDFWTMAPGPERMNNMIHAMKNLSIAGSFLMLAAVGAGRYSVDGPCIMHRTPTAS
jgi:putative oxidoreductase